ncbi:hypothetical protein Tco_0318164 [Tanacetum coccineum]
MDQDSAHMVAASKVPMLKLGEFELWRMRIEQYIRMLDIALWKVIENGATLPKIAVLEGVEKVMPITTAEENATRRLEVKARKVKGMSSSSSSTQNMAFVSSSNNNTSSSNEAVNAAHGVTTASTQSSTCTEDLQQNHPDDIEEDGFEMDIWTFHSRVLHLHDEDILLETSIPQRWCHVMDFGGYGTWMISKGGPNYALMAYSSSSSDSKVSLLMILQLRTAKLITIVYSFVFLGIEALACLGPELKLWILERLNLCNKVVLGQFARDEHIDPNPDIKSVLTQKALDIFFQMFLIPNEVHPQLPSANQTIHEMPTGKIDSLKGWNDHFFWVDAFACPASFPWHTGKSVSKDPFSKSSQFNTEHYASLVAYPTPFRKYPKPFLCLVGISHHYTLDENTYLEFLQMDLLSFIWTVNPTKVRVGERQRAEDEPKLLDTTVGGVVPLLPITPARAESELEASVDKLFDEGDSGTQTDQGDSAGGGGGQAKASKERKTIAADVGEPSHPPKRLREDHETPSGASVGGKSMSAVQRLLVGAVQNAEGEGHIDSVTGLNLRSVSAPQRFVIASDSSHHSGANIAEAEVDSFVRASVPVITVATTITSTVDPAVVVKEKIVKPSLFFADSTSAGGTNPAMGGFTYLTGNDFLVGGIRTVVNPDSDFQKVYVPQWNVTNGFCLDDGGACREMVEEFALPKFFASVREVEIENLKAQLLLKEAEAAEAILLRAKASKFEAIEKSLQDEVKILKDHNTTLENEKSELDVKVADLAASVKVRKQEVHELETSSAGLQEKVTAYKNCMGQLEEFQDERMRVVNDKFNTLYTDFVEVALYLEEKFYPRLLTTIIGRSKAIEKGMQDGLAAGITHGQEGRVLIDVVAFNPSAKSDYVSALQELQDVNFSLLAELKSNKDASVETLMNILLLKETLAERLGLNESQPHVDQLMVPIHHSPDQTIVGSTSLLFSLDVSHNRVQRIKDNIANHRSALRNVFVHLVDPLSSVALEGAKGTSGTAPDTTTTLSTTYASASSIPPISTDDYVVVHADNQEGAGADINPFPNIDDAGLNIS